MLKPNKGTKHPSSIAAKDRIRSCPMFMLAVMEPNANGAEIWAQPASPQRARRNSEFTGSLAEIVDDAAEVGPNCVSHP